MFITLRSSGSGRGQQASGEMQQVARRDAGPTANNGKMRTLRRPACIACQTRKLRCTGSARSCDRCRSRSIDCVFPTITSRAGLSRTSPSHAVNNQEAASQDAVDVSAVMTRGGDDKGSSGSPSVDSSHGTPLAGDDWLDGDVFQFVDGLDDNLILDEFGGHNFEIDNTTNPWIAQNSTSSHWSSHSADQQPPVAPNPLMSSFVSSSEPSTSRSPGPLGTISSPDFPRNLTLNGDFRPPSILPPSQPPKTPCLAFNQTNTHHELPTTSTPSDCQCLTSLLRVVQQFDDDEFHLTTLPLDQVIQLEKWLTFQCYKPLDCPHCLDLSSVHSVILILCDRLTELLECTHKRLQRAGHILSSSSSSSSQTNLPTLDTLPPLAPTPSEPDNNPNNPNDTNTPAPPRTQLFCGTSQGAAVLAACNPMMFSDEFRTRYSDEEQVHMIRVLQRLQLRNYGKLLGRVEASSHARNNPARRWKVQSMVERLARTSADIEGGLGFILGVLGGSEGGDGMEGDD